MYRRTLIVWASAVVCLWTAGNVRLTEVVAAPNEPATHKPANHKPPTGKSLPSQPPISEPQTRTGLQESGVETAPSAERAPNGQTASSSATAPFLHRVLDARYYSEGTDTADIDGDGNIDVICGPFWLAGPGYSDRYSIYQGTDYPNDRGYSNSFFSFAEDVDRDGHHDVVAIGLPGQAAHWYRNPGPDSVRQDGVTWEKHLVFEAVDNESPAFVDLTGDGNRELICNFGGRLGYLKPSTKPTDPWVFHSCSAPGGWHRYTHGLGAGDVNGDGRLDLLTAQGWWEQPASLEDEPNWRPHFYPFSRRRGGGQMFAYDIDGDGDNDVITSLDAHGWGLVWFENLQASSGGIRFRPHRVMDDQPIDSRFGVKFSQLHALALADVDGDKILDVVTGKCYWAHNGADPGAREAAVVYAFLTRRSKEGDAYFEPHEIDAGSGVGRQVVAKDINGDGRTDIVTSNKKGLHLFEGLDGTWRAPTSTWNDTTRPSPRGGRWSKRFELLNERALDENAQLVFLGDSITQGWEGAGKKVWQEFYGSRNAINLGIGGDRTQHVLWRIQNGNGDLRNPKCFVVMIGTNNSGDNSPDDIADGVTRIVRELRFQHPQAKVLLLAIFPRGASPQDKRRQVNEAANARMEKLADGKSVVYMDIGAEFLDSDGNLSREIMPDLLHLSERGYRIWADSIEAQLEQWMEVAEAEPGGR